MKSIKPMKEKVYPWPKTKKTKKVKAFGQWTDAEYAQFRKAVRAMM